MGVGLRVGLLQRAHVLANEAAAPAGRGQAIAPTMDELRRMIQRSRVGAMACPRPGALQQSHAREMTVHTLLSLNGRPYISGMSRTRLAPVPKGQLNPLS